MEGFFRLSGITFTLKTPCCCWLGVEVEECFRSDNLEVFDLIMVLWQVLQYLEYTVLRHHIGNWNWVVRLYVSFIFHFIVGSFPGSAFYVLTEFNVKFVELMLIWIRFSRQVWVDTRLINIDDCLHYWQVISVMTVCYVLRMAPVAKVHVDNVLHVGWFV